MRKVLRIITGIIFVGAVWYAYSTTIYVVTYYRQLISSPDLRSLVFSVLALTVFIASIVLACKLKLKVLWTMIGAATLITFGLFMGFGEQIRRHTELQKRTAQAGEFLEEAGVDLTETDNMVSDLMKEHRAQGEAEYEKGMQFYQAGDGKQTVYWLTKAAKHLYKPAHYKLIEMYSTGDLVEKDLVMEGASGNMMTLLISTPKEGEFLQEVHRTALSTGVEGGPSPHFEIKRIRNEIWADDEWSGK